MAERFPPFGTVPTRPRCHYCGCVIVVDLHAEDELWEAVMREKFGTGYACINCFASRADEKLIDWAPHVRLIPLSLAGQMRVQDEARTNGAQECSACHGGYILGQPCGFCAARGVRATDGKGVCPKDANDSPGVKS